MPSGTSALGGDEAAADADVHERVVSREEYAAVADDSVMRTVPWPYSTARPAAGGFRSVSSSSNGTGTGSRELASTMRSTSARLSASRSTKRRPMPRSPSTASCHDLGPCRFHDDEPVVERELKADRGRRSSSSLSRVARNIRARRVPRAASRRCRPRPGGRMRLAARSVGRGRGSAHLPRGARSMKARTSSVVSVGPRAAIVGHRSSVWGRSTSARARVGRRATPPSTVATCAASDACAYAALFAREGARP